MYNYHSREMEEVNQLTQQGKIKITWSFEDRGPDHKCEYRACIHDAVTSDTISGDWENTKKRAKNSAAEKLVCSIHTKTQKEKATPDRSVMVLADVDNSLDIVASVIKQRNPHVVHAFCSKSFSTKFTSDNVIFHTALSTTKDAAEMAMSFNAPMLVQEAKEQGCTSIVLISKDFAVVELQHQLQHHFKDMEICLLCKL